MIRPLAAVAAFVAIAILVATRAVESADRAVLDAIQAPHADALDLAAAIVTLFGHTEVIGAIAVGIAVAWWRHGRQAWWLPVGLALVLAIELVLKQTLPQAQPPPELSRDVELLPFVRAPTAYAFPSGHVARVAFLVTALRWPTVIAAVVIPLTALALVYRGDHWPTDVLGGWLLGYATAALMRPPRPSA